jgi:hypothetical protein
LPDAAGGGLNCIKKNSKQIKKNNNKGKQNKQRSTPRNKGSLGRKLLTGGLGALGSLMGPVGSSIATSGANWLSDVLGMGDYTISSNSLMNTVQGVPTFSESQHNVRVRHREYLGDITGSVAFTNRTYPINPGLAAVFPWLSNLGYGFQFYKFHGILFEFVSTSANALNSTNTALGSVIMATNYNAALPAYVSKQEAAESQFSCTSTPSKSLIHPIECKPGEKVLDTLYMRSGAVPSGQSPQFYDLGLFQLMTVGMQAAANIGELWVTYDIEFFRPRIPPGVTEGQMFILANGPYVATTNVLGTIQTTPVTNGLGLTITATGGGYDTVNFPSYIQTGRFLVVVAWTGVATNCAYTNHTLTNLTSQSVFDLATSTNALAPFGGTSNSARMTIAFFVTVSGYSSTGSSIAFSASSTLPATPADVTVVVAQVALSNSFV